MIKYHGKSDKVRLGVKIANTFLTGSGSFYEQIQKHGKFDMANTATENIIMYMRETISCEIEYRVYKPWWRWSRAIGYFSASEPFKINVNYYKLKKMSVHQVVGNIVHEYVHLVDNQYPTVYFGHGSNKPQGKEHTAPYWIGRLGKKLSIKHFSI